MSTTRIPYIGTIESRTGRVIDSSMRDQYSRLYDAIRRGESVAAGGRIITTEAELDAWVAAQEAPAAPVEAPHPGPQIDHRTAVAESVRSLGLPALLAMRSDDLRALAEAEGAAVLEGDNKSEVAQAILSARAEKRLEEHPQVLLAEDVRDAIYAGLPRLLDQTPDDLAILRDQHAAGLPEDTSREDLIAHLLWVMYILPAR